MSRSVRDPDRRVVLMFACYECSTCTANLPDASGISLCDRHKEGTE